MSELEKFFNKKNPEKILHDAISDPEACKELAKRMVTKNDNIKSFSYSGHDFIDKKSDIIHILKKENERLKEHISDLQSGTYINCVYCGHRYGPKETTPSSMADILKEHIENCVEHPLYKLKKEFKDKLNEIKIELDSVKKNHRTNYNEFIEYDEYWRGVRVGLETSINILEKL